ncbi:hypothetical protein CYMTET_15542 [Cymbomonas tetramitiformis]|uniref:Uncharacterized protein n=1 Tax=Cymbomonas tetramitiformis TaxID=36881 RepID=A0AAE0L966_9CHLO|nr:hypothetical protein CYMTET_15542 [Cymbomonas tetramitiformis]|eukprot:gene6292-7543_t
MEHAHAPHAPSVLRRYQRRIAERVLNQNAIVVLPTGAGKTLIAAEVVRRALEQERNAGDRGVLFLVPTCCLVEQQAQAVREWFAPRGLVESHPVVEYMGGLARPPPDWAVMVATPDAFRALQARAGREHSEKRNRFAWETIKLCVFDEVHHVLRDHPYRKLALSIPPTSRTQVLGLTASLTYAVDEAKVRLATTRIVQELRVQVLETASAAELEADGYHGNAAAAEIRDEVPVVHRVTGVVPAAQRKPHQMNHTFWQRIRTHTATPFAAFLVCMIRELEQEIARADHSFESPLASPRTASWAQYANKKSTSRSFPGVSNSESAILHKKYVQLEFFYEALKILVISWEEDQEMCAMFLHMCKGHWDEAVHGEAKLGGVRCGEGSLLVDFGAFVDLTLTGCSASSGSNSQGTAFERFASLKEILLAKKAEQDSQGKELRGIVFVQNRLSTHVLDHFIRLDADLRAAAITPACLYSDKSPATARLRISKGEAAETLRRFRIGQVNLLVTTVVAEEGMDIPAANAIVRFDPVLNAVSFVQGRGRARQADSSHVVMAQREDRTVSQLAAAESQQQQIIQQFDPAEVSAIDTQQQKSAQLCRESQAKDGLKSATGLENAVAALNLFVKKTKANLSEKFPCVTIKTCSCTLHYQSCVRTTSASSPPNVTFPKNIEGRKKAKRVAALELVRALQNNMK